MKKLFAFVFVVVILNSHNQFYAQDYKNNRSFTDFFFIKIVNYKDNSYLYYDVDSMKSDSYYNKICSALWAYNQYLFFNYSTILNKDPILSKLIPDTLAIQNQFNTFLTEDLRFKNIFNKTLKKEIIAPIHIDSLMKIASRYFFVHRVGGEILFHLCVGINEVLHFQQNENTPYYNAFCFMAIRNYVNSFDFFDKATEPYKVELNNKVTDERLTEIKNSVYAFLAKDLELKTMLLNEYDKKKEYLNFEIIE